MDARTLVLLQAPIGRTLLRLALPNVVVMVVQASVGLIEIYFIGKLGIDALAGMALVFPILMLIQMVSAGAMGGGILSAIARALGSDRRDDAGVLAWHAVVIAAALGLATTVAALMGGAALYALDGRAGCLARRGRPPIRTSSLRERSRSGCSIRSPPSSAGPATWSSRQP